MGVSRLFGLCAALLFTSSVSAAVTIDLGPSDYRNWGTGINSHTGAGIRSSTGQTVRLPPLNGNLNVTRNAVIPYGSIANGMKNFVRINPASVAASAAITALFLGLDWVFDDELDSWMKQGFETAPVDPNFYYWSNISVPNGGVPYSSPLDYCSSFYDQWNPGSGFVKTGVYSYSPISGSAGSCIGQRYRASDDLTDNANMGPVRRFGNGCPSGYSYDENLNSCARGVLVDLEASDWTRLENELPNSNPNTVGQAGHDAMKRQGAPLPGFQDQNITGPSSVSGSETTSTSTDPVTGDTTITTTQTTTNITYGDTTITTTNTTTTNTYTNGQHTGSETITETPGELPVTDGGGAPPAGEWPGFCEWASIVCDWIGWTQEEPPAEPDLPQVIDDDFYEEKTIQFGSKSCPPDYEISIPFINSTVAVPMQPLCDFAGIIYYMVMAAAYIIAAYITIGVARNG